MQNEQQDMLIVGEQQEQRTHERSRFEVKLPLRLRLDQILRAALPVGLWEIAEVVDIKPRIEGP